MTAPIPDRLEHLAGLIDEQADAALAALAALRRPRLPAAARVALQAALAECALADDHDPANTRSHDHPPTTLEEGPQ